MIPWGPARLAKPPRILGIDEEAVPVDITAWVTKKLLDKATDGLAKRLKKALLGTPVELALIEAVRAGVTEATQQCWPDDPEARRWQDALLERDAIAWPLVDGTDLADLPAAATVWVAEVCYPLDAEGRPERLDAGHPLVAPLSEEILKAVRHNATRGDGRLKGLWDDFRIHELGNPREGDDPARLQRLSFDPVIVFLADFEQYLEGFGPGIEGLQALLKRLPEGVGPIVDGVAYGSANEFINAHGLGRTRVLGHDSPLETLAFLLKIAWQTGYFMYEFRRYGRLPHASRSVDPLAVMDQTVAIAAATGNAGTAIEAFLQKAVSLRTEPAAIRRTCLTVFTDATDVERMLEPHLDQWAETLRTAYGYGLLVAGIVDDAHGS